MGNLLGQDSRIPAREEETLRQRIELKIQVARGTIARMQELQVLHKDILDKPVSSLREIISL